MRLSDFILLNEEEKRQTVLHHGILLSKRRLPSDIIFLFQVYGFYVEACFNLETKRLEEFRMFCDTSLLQPYLDEICIEELLQPTKGR